MDYIEKFFLPSKIRKKILRMGGEELSFRIDGQKIEEGYALVASVLFILNSYCVSTSVFLTYHSSFESQNNLHTDWGKP